MPAPTHHIRKIRAAEAGFTLVEALAAIVILSFGLMAVANLMVVATSSNSVANQSMAATMAATQQMERLKVAVWGSAFPAPPPPPEPAMPGLLVPAPGTTFGDLDVDAAPYVTSVDIALPGEVARVPVRVRWTVTGVDPWTIFIRVRAEAVGPLAGNRTRAEFTSFRSCTTGGPACP